APDPRDDERRGEEDEEGLADLAVPRLSRAGQDEARERAQRRRGARRGRTRAVDADQLVAAVRAGDGARAQRRDLAAAADAEGREGGRGARRRRGSGGGGEAEGGGGGGGGHGAGPSWNGPVSSSRAASAPRLVRDDEAGGDGREREERPVRRRDDAAELHERHGEHAESEQEEDRVVDARRRRLPRRRVAAHLRHAPRVEE